MPLRILFFGMGDFSTVILEHLLAARYNVAGIVFNQSNNPEIQKMKLLAHQHQIRFWETDNLNSGELFTELSESERPDLILVANFNFLLPPKLYSLARIAAINLHPSYLPYYRGNFPFFWTIFNGEKFTGVTYHHISAGFDEGDIIAQEKVEIRPEDTMGMVVTRQKVLAWKILQPLLEQIAATGQPPKAVPQPAGDFPKAPKLKLQDTVIDWRWSSEKIIDQIRGLNPYNPALTVFRGQTIGLYQATATKHVSDQAPGTIIGLDAAGPVVKTGNSALRLEIIYYLGKYLRRGGDFIDLERVSLNERFGQ